MSTMRASSLASWVMLMATAAGVGFAALACESAAWPAPTKPIAPSARKLLTKILRIIASLVRCAHCEESSELSHTCRIHANRDEPSWSARLLAGKIRASCLKTREGAKPMPRAMCDIEQPQRGEFESGEPGGDRIGEFPGAEFSPQVGSSRRGVVQGSVHRGFDPRGGRAQRRIAAARADPLEQHRRREDERGGVGSILAGDI